MTDTTKLTDCTHRGKRVPISPALQTGCVAGFERNCIPEKMPFRVRWLAPSQSQKRRNCEGEYDPLVWVRGKDYSQRGGRVLDYISFVSLPAEFVALDYLFRYTLFTSKT